MLLACKMSKGLNPQYGLAFRGDASSSDPPTRAASGDVSSKKNGAVGGSDATKGEIIWILLTRHVVHSGDEVQAFILCPVKIRNCSS
jgi:hypothetical protein